ncbi:hypothetical protein HPP92_027348 [Vanilla planifolia]|uniref:Uncharacterized protein n=1 Tax=Vanilla planifolia TaxID=51239 RepID=A0A835U679_VANPL|nr:hypothetical protein HPP92_027348 [Vanilla planifolia]
MERQQEGCEWHAVLEEAEDLAGLQKRKQNSFNTSDAFESRRSQQGARSRSRFKFSFQQFPKDEDLLCVYSLKDGAYNSFEEDIEMHADWDIFEHRASENIETQFCMDVVEESAEVNSRFGFHEQRSEAPSLSELLENLQKANNPLDRRNSVASKGGSFGGSCSLDYLATVYNTAKDFCQEITLKGKARQMHSSKLTPLHLGNGVLGIEDPYDFKGADSFGDDRYIDQVSQTNQFDKGKASLDNGKGKAGSKRTHLPLGDRVLDIEDPLEFISSDSHGDDQYANQGCQTNQFNKGQPILDGTKGKAKEMRSSKQTEFHLGDKVFIGADSSGNDKYIDQVGHTNQFDKEIAILSDQDFDIEDPLEFIGANSSGYEKHTKQDCQAGHFGKGQTMLDLFQDAFDSAAEERAAFHSYSFGYHGRLQEVIQLEKDRDIAYMKQLQTERRPSNESQCIHVRILSKVLEAKLAVCQCLFAENCNNMELEQRYSKGCFKSSNSGETMKRTIIFCPRICSNTELEIGSLVCVHPPWKEVQVNEGSSSFYVDISHLREAYHKFHSINNGERIPLLFDSRGQTSCSLPGSLKQLYNISPAPALKERFQWSPRSAHRLSFWPFNRSRILA